MKKKHWSDNISVRLFNGLIDHLQISSYKLFDLPLSDLKKIELKEFIKRRKVGKVTVLELRKLIGKFADEPIQSTPKPKK